jgi:hypothetical protein
MYDILTLVVGYPLAVGGMVVHEAFHSLHERYVSGRLQQSQDAPALTLALVSGTRKGSPTSTSLEGTHVEVLCFVSSRSPNIVCPRPHAVNPVC